MYEWDDNKNKKNAGKHGVSFDAMEGFDWDTALVVEDARSSELRWIGYGFIGVRLFAVVFTVRGENIRVISLRKANKREQRIYANG
ncbi:BrnT family toxin [Terasakiella sp.]|uniref:BrnT family toxin n=1 Tax=Terasakiella sp. TaxID=2034861 RepID=UPI003AA90CBD